MTKNISDKHYVERDNKLDVLQPPHTPGSLEGDRADVIVPAASIFLMVADHSGAQRILVPSLGLADGIINDLM